MPHTVFRLDELEWIERDNGRSVARLSDALTHSRANVWRFPPGTKGVRHVEKVQEEAFVVVAGTLTLVLGDPEPERVEVPRGGVAVVQPGTALQMRNEGDEELVVVVWGAPPEAGQAEYLEDVD